MKRYVIPLNGIFSYNEHTGSQVHATYLKLIKFAVPAHPNFLVHSPSMICFPHAKINLGLKVASKRNDGYHDIVSILYPIGLCDILEIIPANEDNGTPILDTSGETGHVAREDDLLLRAYEALPAKSKAYIPHIHIHKRIPIGAGLGGGSSDAAHLIRHFAGKGPDPFDPEDPFKLAASRIGSDVPFFLQDRPTLVSGRGERMAPFQLDLGGWNLLLVVPPFKVSTAKAYDGSVTSHAPFPTDLNSYPVEEWGKYLKNELEGTVIQTHPELQDIKNALYRAGASYASMSGSGSSVYGLFRENPPDIPGIEDHSVWREELPSLT